jgi:uncharacterized protein YfeS
MITFGSFEIGPILFRQPRNIIKLALPASASGRFQHLKTIQTMDFFADPKKGANAKAKRLMNEDFFWSPIAESGPFGNDSGSEAAEGFNEWRKANKTGDPVDYLRELISSWGFPSFDWNLLDPVKISEYVQIKANTDNIVEQVAQFKEILKNSPSGLSGDSSDEILKQVIRNSAENMGGTYLLQIDNGIIGTGFAQLAIEGKIDRDLQYLTSTAIKRQLLPILIERYDEDHKEMRKQILTKMLNVVDNANL